MDNVRNNTLEELDFLKNPIRVREMNNSLSAAQRLLRPLKTADIAFQCVFLHVGPGIYDKTIDPGIHQHPELQLEFILDGDFTFDLQNTRITLAPGDGLLIPPHMPHTWHCTETGSILGAIIEISGREAGQFIQKLTEYSIHNPVIHSPSAVNCISQVFDAFLVNSSMPWSTEKIANLIELWMIDLLENELQTIGWNTVNRSLIKVPRERSREAADNIMHFLETNYMHPINLHNIMLHIGLSARHANRIFKEKYSETINQALMRIRLDHALKQLQAQPNVPIKAVAYNTGFSSTSYFTRCFREAFGMPPKYVRKGQGLNIRRINQ